MEILFEKLKLQKPVNQERKEPQEEELDEESDLEDRRLETEELDEQFEEFADLTVSIGTYLLLGLVVVVLLILLFLSSLQRSFTKYRFKLKNELFWNSTSRIFLEGYL